MTYLYTNVVSFNESLSVDPDLFRQGYNYPIENLVERRPGGRNEVTYMSYTHAIRILRELFPSLSAECEINPLTGSYLFEEPDGRGYFMRAYVHDGKARSSLYYYGILDTSMAPILPGQVVTYRDKKTQKTEIKTYLNNEGEYVPVPALNSQAINKAYYRALCKAIAFTTGIGLKLWTGEDLSDPEEAAPPAPVDKTVLMLERINALSKEYTSLTNLTFDLSVDSTNPDELIAVGKKLKKLVEDAREGIAAPPAAPSIPEAESLTIEEIEQTDSNDNLDPGVEEEEVSTPKRTRARRASAALAG